MSRVITPAQRDNFIQFSIDKHIARLVDVPRRHESTLNEEQRQKRRELQCQREEREANREVWE